MRVWSGPGLWEALGNPLTRVFVGKSDFFQKFTWTPDLTSYTVNFQSSCEKAPEGFQTSLVGLYFLAINFAEVKIP